MYFPKSQIKTNQITNGDEYQYLSSGIEYIGYYFTTSTGKVYTGKTPNDTPTRELILINKGYDIDKLDADDDDGLNTWDIESSVYTISDAYLNATKLKFPKNAPLPPTQCYPKPTKKDYQNGEILRFFASKINDHSIVEIDIDQYKLYNNQAPSTQFRLYQTFNLFWQITGTKSKVFNTNKNIVTAIQNNLKIQYFTQYFQGKFDQYRKPGDKLESKIEENLSTNGTEFINRRTKTPYSGAYHIHPDKGPMVGAKHISTSHDYLDYITESPTSGSSAYETVISTRGGGSFGGGGGGY
jgi:hypothetical protein